MYGNRILIINFFLYSVHSLKENIESQHGIPAANQVLLISGGEILQHGMKVYSYSSGTDTSPIFMFSTSFVEPGRNPPHLWPSIESGKLHDFFFFCTGNKYI